MPQLLARALRADVAKLRLQNAPGAPTALAASLRPECLAGLCHFRGGAAKKEQEEAGLLLSALVLNGAEPGSLVQP